MNTFLSDHLLAERQRLSRDINLLERRGYGLSLSEERHLAALKRELKRLNREYRRSFVQLKLPF